MSPVTSFGITLDDHGWNWIGTVLGTVEGVRGAVGLDLVNDLDEAPGYRKQIYATRQVPVVLTLVNQEDIAAIRQGLPWTAILQGELVRAMKEAHAQGSLLTTSDLSMLFHHSHSRGTELIRQYET